MEFFYEPKQNDDHFVFLVSRRARAAPLQHPRLEVKTLPASSTPRQEIVPSALLGGGGGGGQLPLSCCIAYTSPYPLPPYLRHCLDTMG